MQSVRSLYRCAQLKAAMSTVADQPVVALDEMRSFVKRCMIKAGTPEDHASDLAELLVIADYRGHYSHGLNRLEMYYKDVTSGTTSVADRCPEVEKETVSTALVNGKNLLGPTVGKFCMDLAIKKARETGIAWVVANDSNHFGIAGWYSMRACDQGMVGMAFTNTSPIVSATRARDQTLGTNPLAVAAPGNNGDNFALDMATSAVSFGKVRNFWPGFRSEGQTIPCGWAVDKEGKGTNDPFDVTENGGGLMPLGGTEECGGYKGYGLAMMVDIFCAVLSGANSGPAVRHWKNRTDVAHIGQCFVAVDTQAFAEGFTDRMSTLLDHHRGLEPVEGETEVLVAGDKARQHMAKCDELGGIPYTVKQVQRANDFAQSIGVEPLKCL